jgi:hypothetical protein
LALVGQLEEFACLIAHPGVRECKPGAGVTRISTLLVYSDLVSLILEGLESHAASKMRARICNLIKLSVRHHHLDASDSIIAYETKRVMSYMDDGDRSVRLAAG